MSKKTFVIWGIIGTILAAIVIAPYLIFTGLGIYETVTLDYNYHKKQKRQELEKKCAEHTDVTNCNADKKCEYYTNHIICSQRGDCSGNKAECRVKE